MKILVRLEKHYMGIIQTLLLVIMALTFWCQKKNNEEQLRLNNTYIRPWIYITADSGGFLTISDSGLVRASQWLVNVGGAPACSIKTASYVNFEPDFPVDEIRQMIKNDTNPRAPYLFPGQKPVTLVSTPQVIVKYESCYVRPRVPIPTDTCTKNDTVFMVIVNPGKFPVEFDTISRKIDTVRSREEIFNLFADSSFHLHTYIRYHDAQHKNYCLRNTFYAKCVSTSDSSMDIEIYSTYNSEDPIE